MKLVVDIQKSLGGFRLETTFTAEDGVTGLLGASGCGKSMTLKCIAGVVTPDEGHISLDGVTLFDSAKHINLRPQQRHVGYLFQNYALFPNMTVQQNILTGLRHENAQAVRASACAEAIRLFGLSGLEKRRPSQLSGGQQQRVALARILVNRPQLLMLDEPFSALDTHLRERLQLEMKDLLATYGGPALMVTHSRDEAYRLCSRIALMENGTLLTLRPTKRLFADPGTSAAARMTGCKNISRAEKRGEHELFATDWGVTFKTAQPLRDGLTGVGIRAHYFNERAAENRYPIMLEEILEEPFEFTIPFRYAGQSKDTPSLWWRLPKEQRPNLAECTLGVAPANVLPLYDGCPYPNNT